MSDFTCNKCHNDITQNVISGFPHKCVPFNPQPPAERAQIIVDIRRDMEISCESDAVRLWPYNTIDWLLEELEKADGKLARIERYIAGSNGYFARNIRSIISEPTESTET